MVPNFEPHLSADRQVVQRTHRKTHRLCTPSRLRGKKIKKHLRVDQDLYFAGTIFTQAGKTFLMKQSLAAILFAFTIAACNQGEETTTTTTDSTTTHADSSDEVVNEIIPPAKPSGITGCYMRVLQRDTLVARLQQDGDRVSGKLTFDNYQKDGSTGSVSGRVNGDIIELIYSFDAEGMHSIMEVYFKKQGNSLIRGIGEMGMRGDTMGYKNPQQLSYPAEEKWDGVNCESLDAKYR